MELSKTLSGASKAFFKGDDSAGREGGLTFVLTHLLIWKVEVMADISVAR